MEELQQFSMDDLKIHPEQIIPFLSQEGNFSLVLNKQGDQITLYQKPSYNPKILGYLQKAKAELERRNKKGYTDEEASKDFMKAQDKISSSLQSDSFS